MSWYVRPVPLTLQDIRRILAFQMIRIRNENVNDIFFVIIHSMCKNQIIAIFYEQISH